ncbi:MAG: molecular chaperone DnaJ [Proteobacteria bacterium]|nr:molecular chaperone DnaJ [Pseudomonadota bacterium]
MFILYMIAGLAIAFVLWSLLRALADVPPRKIVAGAKVAGAGLGALGALWLMVTGRIWGVLAFGSYFAPQLLRAFNSWRIGRRAAAAPGDEGSDVETAWLAMRLDHATGAMDGLVREGTYRGRRLSELDAASLLALLAECRLADPDAGQLLETYLDRTHPDWRQASAGAGAAPSAGPMDRAEAARLLGVPVDADAETVKAAHRRLMMKVHPDHGGSDYLAAKINEAKRLLLGE